MTIFTLLLLFLLLLCGFEADLPVFYLHGFLSIAFPYVLLFTFIVFLLGCFFKKKIAVIIFLGGIIVFPRIKKIVAFSFPHKTEVKENQQSVKVLSWNVRRFIGPLEKNLDKNLSIEYFTSLIKKQDPDFVCLMDFASKKNPISKNISIAKLKKSLRMPYHYFHIVSESSISSYRFGNVILSKHRILKSHKKIFTEYYIKKSGIAFIECKIGGKPLRIYTSHFQSFGLKEKDFKELKKIKYQQEFDKEVATSLYIKMAQTIPVRNKQVMEAMQYLGESKVPVLFATDLNDVPNSFAYRSIDKEYTDAFLETGFHGVGRTYLRLLPTLRIDYLFVDNTFTVNSFKVIKKEISDHYPIVGTFSF